jgi:hypothetical protein
VFRYDARELFLDYAKRCDKKQNIADIILKVNQTDNYGVRDTLINCAGECLPESVIRTMIETLERWSEEEQDEYGKRHQMLLIESLARQIKDAVLFEKTRIASRGSLSTSAIIDIAGIYLKNGDVETAYSRLKEIPEDETSYVYERDKLLEEIFKRQGNTEKLLELRQQQFRKHHSVDTLDDLLEVIGHDKRHEIIADAIAHIHQNDGFRELNAEFLIAVGEIDEAESYLLEHADSLNGYHYSSLLDLAKTFAAEKRHLAASLIYRSLLVSILDRAYAKAYPHGIRYLKKLDKLSALITDWKNFDNHETFKEQIFKTHFRKRSFWSRYEATK